MARCWPARWNVGRLGHIETWDQAWRWIRIELALLRVVVVLASCRFEALPRGFLPNRMVPCELKSAGNFMWSPFIVDLISLTCQSCTATAQALQLLIICRSKSDMGRNDSADVVGRLSTSHTWTIPSRQWKEDSCWSLYLISSDLSRFAHL